MNVVLDIFRKNVLSFVCLLIAILAAVAVFVWPLPGNFASLQAKLNARKAEFESLDGLLKKQRQLPIVDPGETTGRVLEQYPTPLAIKRAEEVAGLLVAEGKKVLALAAQYNEHKLLVGGSLPNTSYTRSVEFQEAYTREMDYANVDRPVREKTLPFRVLKANIPPTEQDVQNEAARREEALRAENPPGAGDAALQNQIAQMRLDLPNEMRSQVAKDSQMYMNPDAIDVYPGIMVAAGATVQPTAPSIYFAQVGLWVQQDVFASLAKANEGSSGVVTSPVKHLLKIDVVEDYGKTAAPGAAVGQPMFTGFGGGAGGLPILTNTLTGFAGGGVVAGPEGQVVAPLGATARTSGPIYDVIPFKLVINVDATQIPKVLTELSRNKFITVTKCDIIAREATSEMLLGYYYGPVPVVQLTLECEMLLLKNWLTPFMPPSIAAPPTAPPA